jgi:hypothetical protein
MPFLVPYNSAWLQSGMINCPHSIKRGPFSVNLSLSPDVHTCAGSSNTDNDYHEGHWPPLACSTRPVCLCPLCVTNLAPFMSLFPLTCLALPSDIFTTLVSGSTSSSAAVRQPVNNSPITSATDTNLRCNINSPATQTLLVTAGSVVTFKLDNTLYHAGPAAFYRASSHLLSLLLYLTNLQSVRCRADKLLRPGMALVRIGSRYCFFCLTSNDHAFDESTLFLRSPNGALPSTPSHSWTKT